MGKRHLEVNGLENVTVIDVCTYLEVSQVASTCRKVLHVNFGREFSQEVNYQNMQLAMEFVDSLFFIL